jgi:RNA methyltransferase, TrmH family
MSGMTPAYDDLVATVEAARSDRTRVVLEGVHAVKHALRFGAVPEVLLTPDRAALDALVAQLAPDLGRLDAAEVDGAAWERAAGGALPSPALGVCVRPEVDVTVLLCDPDPAPVVLLEDPTHLGNVGAVVRFAAAAGAGGVLVTGTVDPWHPTVVRGAAGLQFAVPPARLGDLALLDAVAHGREVVCLDAGGDTLTAGVLPPRALLAFGTERRGLSPALRSRAGRTLAIPMRAGVSSLNLATAVAVVLYAGA